ncbi:MAG: ROK family protein [Niabella sp.]
MNSRYAIGVDVGGTALKFGIVDNEGQLIQSFTAPVQGDEQAIIAQIKDCVQQAVALVDHSLIEGVGIGFPGIVENNIIIGGADNLPGFEQLSLGNLLEAQTGYNVVIDNDANMMALGELVYGAAQGCTDIVFLTVGTGIGGALVLNNRLYGGYKNRGTELGHIIVQYNGNLCTCGSKGCLEAYASVTSLIEHYKTLRKELPGTVNGKQIVAAYLQQEPEAVAAMNRHFDYMAAGIAGYVNIFSPQKVVVGGGISEAGDFYIREIEKRVKVLAMPAAYAYTELVTAALGNKAGLLGCAANVFRSLAKVY